MKTENNKNIIMGVVGIIVLIATFYGGVIYGKKQTSNTTMTQGNFMGNGGNRGMRGNFGGLTTGEILSMDAQSITLKLRDGGSKIIFYSDKTTIAKMVDGTISDLKIGGNISVTGTANTDGSINAQSVQIRPSITPTTPSVVK